MPRIFGLDIGTTSIGFAVIDCDFTRDTGRVLRLGARIFPEARDPDGTPKNQQRRQKRMMRRQSRRRRVRRQLLNELLSSAGLLPAFGSADWPRIMAVDPYGLRDRGLDEPLSPHQIGRMVYHLAKRRHFKGRDMDDDAEADDAEEGSDEKAARSERDMTLSALKAEGVTLGRWLSGRDGYTRKRGVHAARAVVEDEFEKLWTAQSAHHPSLRDADLKARVWDATFAQRPVFWRWKTLGTCRFEPVVKELCPKGSWLSQERRMLEKLNNLAFSGGNGRPLDAEERAAILDKLRSQASMTWGGARTALKPLYQKRGAAGAEKSVRFNLEVGGEKNLIGNVVEAKLARIFGDAWAAHPHRQAIRDATHARLWEAGYGEIGDRQRVVIRSQAERTRARADAAQSFIDDFGITPEQAAALGRLTFPTGWEPFSSAALQRLLPHLEAGVRFGALLTGPDWERWRDQTFPNRERPTGEVHDRLPSPATEAESRRIAELRNPTVVRTQNELRKVVNNLIGLYGKPDLIRVELARDVGKSKREREEIQTAIRKNERRRKEATTDLKTKGFAEPSRDDVEKWLLWKESQEKCPYTGDHIGFDALFRENLYQVEHIWPRSWSFDDSFRNKTLCRRDVNLAKGNRTPHEHFAHLPEQWTEIGQRLDTMIGPNGMSPGKVRRFLAKDLPNDFKARQLNDTGYAARQAVVFLKQLWPDLGPEAPVNVQAVSGKITAQLRKAWGLNNILSDNGEKTRADHRHHAVDALVVACAHGGYTQKLSAYLQAKDDPTATERPRLSPPWPGIRGDAEAAVAAIVVSHRVRKKVSGPLHKETVYGDTGEDVTTKTGTYRLFVTRKKVEALSKGELDDIRDERVKQIVKEWVMAHGGDPKKAFATYPRLGEGGPEIRKVRLLSKQQLSLMAPVSTGFADLGANHHIAIYRHPDGKVEFEVVSLFEAARRLARREPVVRRHHPQASFVMSLAPGDAVVFPDDHGQSGYRIVQGVWAAGQVVTWDHRDAEGKTVWRPNAASLIKSNARKVSIDPIGRLRPAND